MIVATVLILEKDGNLNFGEQELCVANFGCHYRDKLRQADQPFIQSPPPLQMKCPVNQPRV